MKPAADSTRSMALYFLLNGSVTCPPETQSQERKRSVQIRTKAVVSGAVLVTDHQHDEPCRALHRSWSPLWGALGLERQHRQCWTLHPSQQPPQRGLGMEHQQGPRRTLQNSQGPPQSTGHGASARTLQDAASWGLLWGALGMEPQDGQRRTLHQSWGLLRGALGMEHQYGECRTLYQTWEPSQSTGTEHQPGPAGLLPARRPASADLGSRVLRGHRGAAEREDLPSPRPACERGRAPSGPKPRPRLQPTPARLHPGAPGLRPLPPPRQPGTPVGPLCPQGPSRPPPPARPRRRLTRPLSTRRRWRSSRDTARTPDMLRCARNPRTSAPAPHQAAVTQGRGRAEPPAAVRTRGPRWGGATTHHASVEECAPSPGGRITQAQHVAPRAQAAGPMRMRGSDSTLDPYPLLDPLLAGGFLRTLGRRSWSLVGPRRLRRASGPGRTRAPSQRILLWACRLLRAPLLRGWWLRAPDGPLTSPSARSVPRLRTATLQGPRPWHARAPRPWGLDGAQTARTQSERSLCCRQIGRAC